ncbi:MAG: YicC/YloC family endoribonuclease [Gemmatimonadota bacterium]
MTGFGAGAAELEGASVNVEMRSVNSRHLKLNLRLPPGGERWEPTLRELVASRIGRGHVDVSVRVESRATDGGRYVLDQERADAYLEGLEELRERHGLSGEPTLALLAGCDDLLVERTSDPGPGIATADLVGPAEVALAELVEMREREGERLEDDVRGRIGEIGARIARVRALAPRRVERERERLRAAVRELADGLDADEDRLAREIAILADRWDVSEELVRAGSHLAGMEELLDGPADEGVGKRLSFFSQELLREVNTIGSKANDAEISREVVEMKNELESLREQIENIE